MKTKIYWNQCNEGYINNNQTLSRMYYSFDIYLDEKTVTIYYYNNPKDLLNNPRASGSIKLACSLEEAKSWCERFLKLNYLNLK